MCALCKPTILAVMGSTVYLGAEIALGGGKGQRSWKVLRGKGGLSGDFKVEIEFSKVIAPGTCFWSCRQHFGFFPV